MNESISLAKFLSRYLGLSGENLKKLTHEDVKMMFPYLKRTSFERIDNEPELLYENEVLLVNDGKKTIPYIAPNTVINDFTELECEICNEDIIIDDNVYDYSKLSTYELKQLLRHAYNSYRNQRMAKHELENRGIVKKKYNRNEFKNYK